jgi:glutathione S-transferase
LPVKLYAVPGSYLTQTLKICAKYAELELGNDQPGNDKTENPIPVLETDQGCIFSTNAIARYLAGIRRDVGLAGQNLLEAGTVDSWVEYSVHQLEVPLMTWVLDVTGEQKCGDAVVKMAKADTDKALSVLNNHLLHCTYMVGHRMTLADVRITCALNAAFKALPKDFCQACPNILRWYNLCTAQPQVAAVLGAAAPSGGGKKGTEAKPKAEAKAKADAKPKAEAKKGGDKKKEEAKPKAEAKKGGDKKKGDKKEEKKEEEKPVDAAEEYKKKLKKVLKEGGKRGVEIEGAGDMGGLRFFSTSVDEPQGDLDLLVKCVEAMNAEAIPGEEERKGCSGHMGKMVFSAGTEQLAVCAYVPAVEQPNLSCEEWLKATLANFQGKVVSADKTYCTGTVQANGDKGIFPLKIREPMILEANNFLRKKGLFPDNDSDDDDEMVFGDDDFPS